MKRESILLSILLFWGCTANRGEKSDQQAFTLIEPEFSGILFSNDIKEDLSTNIITNEDLYNGGGVAAGDINNDGLPDLYFTSNQGDNKLYLNSGDFRFEDITTSAGVAGNAEWSTGVTMVDINGDNLLDIYVSNSGLNASEEKRRNELFINNGDNTFSERAAEYGLDDASYSTQALFVDLDNDNDLDLFLLNRPPKPYPNNQALALRGQKGGGSDKVFRNDGSLFTDVSTTAGIIQNSLGYGLGVCASDLNKDGWVDLYVANDYMEPDYIYLNKGDFSFEEVGKKATNHMSNFSMGVDIADFNNDSWPDVFVADMAPFENYRQKTMMRPMDVAQFNWAVRYGFHFQYMFNTLQLNNGDGTFSDVAQINGLATTDWSWAPLFADFDNDSNLDLFITNGFRKEYSNKDFTKKVDKEMGAAMEKSLEERRQVMEDLLKALPETKLPNFIFRNTGDLSFEDKSSSWGLDIPSYSNGASYADLDNDGDLDIIVNNIDQKAFVFRNNTAGNSVRIQLQGPQMNSSGIGAKLELYASGRTFYKEHNVTHGYQSATEDLIHFGLGELTADSIEVTWPDGKSQVVRSVQTRMTISHADASLQKSEESEQTPFFTDITSEVGLEKAFHLENTHNDFATEVLLPHKMSQFGPALAVGDVNNDGREDFFLGGSSGNKASVYLQMADGSFEERTSPAILRDRVFEDVGATFFDVDGDLDLDLYVTSGGNEWMNNSAYYEDRLYLNEDGVFERAKLPPIRTSNSVVRPFDMDGDGDLDLFVGSKLTPLNYPVAAKSWLLRNDGGNLTDVTEEYNSRFTSLGLISDADWADLDNDGLPELVVVGEWTTIMIFEVEDGQLVDRTTDYGFDALQGWWYAVKVADLNQDGRQDILAGNLGLNYKYKASEENPFHVFYDDFDGNGSGDIVLGYHDIDGELYPLRGRQCSSQQIPEIAQRFDSYDDFGKADIEEVYGKNKLNNALNLAANTFTSKVLLNGDNQEFEVMDLPPMAQISSINTLLVDDFNGDAIDDILYAGNLYPVEIETTRNDASFGGLLLGSIDGAYEYLGAASSGFNAGGDVKHIEKIKLVGNKTGILLARNSGRFQVFSVNEQTQKQMAKN